MRLSTPRPRPAPELRPPLAVRWGVDAGAGLIDLRPLSDGQTVVVSGDAVVGLAAADGARRWRQQLAGRVLDMAATDAGPVVAHGTDRQSILTGLSWSGEVRWRAEQGLALAGGSLRGLGDHLLVAGVRLGDGARQVCQIVAAGSGAVEAELPFVGADPELVPRGVLSSNRGGGPAETGLWLYDVAAARRVRLAEAPHEARAVAGAIAVFDTTDVDGDPGGGELVAVDTGSGARLWAAPGGPGLTIAVDEGQVASVVARGGAGLAAALRDLDTGALAWESDPIAGSDAVVMLAADALLLFVDGAALHVFDRASGALVQRLDEPSTLVGGGAFAGGGLVDVCGAEVRLLK